MISERISYPEYECQINNLINLNGSFNKFITFLDEKGNTFLENCMYNKSFKLPLREHVYSFVCVIKVFHYWTVSLPD